MNVLGTSVDTRFIGDQSEYICDSRPPPLQKTDPGHCGHPRKNTSSYTESTIVPHIHLQIPTSVATWQQGRGGLNLWCKAWSFSLTDCREVLLCPAGSRCMSHPTHYDWPWPHMSVCLEDMQRISFDCLSRHVGWLISVYVLCWTCRIPQHFVCCNFQ